MADTIEQLKDKLQALEADSGERKPSLLPSIARV